MPRKVVFDKAVDLNHAARVVVQRLVVQQLLEHLQGRLEECAPILARGAHDTMCKVDVRHLGVERVDLGLNRAYVERDGGVDLAASRDARTPMPWPVRARVCGRAVPCRQTPVTALELRGRVAQLTLLGTRSDRTRDHFHVFEEMSF